MALPNIRVLKNFEESQGLMKVSKKHIVRLQIKFDIHSDRSFTGNDYQMLVKNCDFFFKMAAKCPDVDFVLVTDDTVCYWTFYNGKNWNNVDNNGGGNSIVFDEEKLRNMAKSFGIHF